MWVNSGYFVFLFITTIVGLGNGNPLVSIPSVEKSTSVSKQIAAEPAEDHSVFISYRRTQSRHLAMLIKLLLQKQNVSAYLDVEDLVGGFWDEQLMTALHKASNFVIVLSVGTLDRSIGDTNFNDYLHKEIREAVHSNSTRVIPVFDFFDFPNPDLFSPEIQTVLQTEGVTWNNTQLADSIQKVIDHLQN